MILSLGCFSSPSEQSGVAEFRKINIQFEDISLVEGENGLFYIQLDRASAEDLNVQWTIFGEDVDSRFKFTSGIAAILKNAKRIPVQITSLDDSIFNPNIIYKIKLELVTDARQEVVFKDTDFVLIDNDPRPVISFSNTSGTVSEGSGTISIDLETDRLAGKDLSVLLSMNASSVADDSDIELNYSLIIPAKQSSISLNAILVDDINVEGNEDFILEIIDSTYEAISIDLDSSKKLFTLSIIDNESLIMADPTSISLEDLTANAGYARGQLIDIDIDEDEYTTAWCVSELQVTKPVDQSSPCVGGAGADNGWYLLTNEGEPSQFNLSGGDSSKTIYVWTANYFGNVSSNPASANIVLDTVAPTLTLGNASGQGASDSNLPVNFVANVSEEVLGFSSLDVYYKGSVLSPTASIATADNKDFSIAITSVSSSGTLILKLPANSFTDLAGNPNLESVDGTANFVDLQLNGGTDVYRSVGPGASASLASGSDSGLHSLNISSSLAYFGADLADKVGAGDVLEYDADDNGSLESIAFIKERHSNSVFEVVNELGEPVSDFSTNDFDWVIHRAYTSLQNAMSGVTNASIALDFDSWSGGKDLVSADQEWNLLLYADAVDTTVVTGNNNWVTSGFNRLKIYTPLLSSQSIKRQRHKGLWENSYYRLEPASGVSSLNLANIDHVVVEGLQLSPPNVNSSNRSAIRITGKWASIRNNIIKDSGSGFSIGIRVMDSSSSLVQIYNNLIYDFSDHASDVAVHSAATDSSADLDLFNNSIVNCSKALVGSSSNVRFMNNIVHYSGGVNMVSGNFSFDSNFNFSTDDSVPGSNSILNQSLSFNDFSGKDFRLALSDTSVMELGLDLRNMVEFIDTDLSYRKRLNANFDLGALSANLTPYTWIGLGGDSNWSTDANWFGGNAPSSAEDMVNFNYLCASNCNSNVDADFNIGTLILEIDYGANLELLPSYDLGVKYNYAQESGSFIINDSLLNVKYGNYNFGIVDDYYVGEFMLRDGSFNLGTGHLKIKDSKKGVALIDSGRANIDFSMGELSLARESAGNPGGGITKFYMMGRLNVANLNVVAPTNYQSNRSSVRPFNAFVVSEKLSLVNVAFEGRVDLYGNLELGNTHSFVFSYSFGYPVNIVRFLGSNSQEYKNFSLGNTTANFEIEKTAGAQLAPASDSFSDLRLSSLNIFSGSFLAPTGTLSLGSQKLNNNSSNFKVFGASMMGEFLHNNGSLEINGRSDSSPTYTIEMDSGDSFYHLVFSSDDLSSGNTVLVDFSQSDSPLVVENNLQLDANRFGGGVIELKGDLSIGANYGALTGDLGGDGGFKFTGTTDQSFTVAGNDRLPQGGYEINKASGNFVIQSDLNFLHSTQDVNLVAGNVLQNAYDVSINDVLNISAGSSWDTACGALSYASLTGTGTLSTGSSNPNISIADSSSNESDDISFTVSLDTYSCAGDLNVDFVTSNSTAYTMDYDYEYKSSNITIPQGSTSQSFSITVYDDTYWEADEQFSVRISNNNFGTIIDDTAVGTIVDNDNAQAEIVVWTGLAGDSLWSSPGNWSTNSVPGESDVAYFDDTCSNCNATIDVDVSVKAIRVQTDFSGAVVQSSGFGITTSVDGRSFFGGGSFALSDSYNYFGDSITIADGSFDAGTSTFVVDRDILAQSGSSDLSQATLGIRSNEGSRIQLNSQAVKNLLFTKAGCTTTNLIAQTLVVTGDFTQSTGVCGVLNNGTIEVGGNVIAT
ncbi:MAG: Calx-beta domain-containing protein, partial [Bdellovibrionota bacterium]|nr:Calx-beta domain-containing protein [Bdellovibrionota bacterium]